MRAVQSGGMQPPRPEVQQPTPRAYQAELIDRLRDGRSYLVSLGTGSGKTLIAAHAVMGRLAGLRAQGQVGLASWQGVQASSTAPHSLAPPPSPHLA